MISLLFPQWEKLELQQERKEERLNPRQRDNFKFFFTRTHLMQPCAHAG